MLPHRWTRVYRWILGIFAFIATTNMLRGSRSYNKAFEIISDAAYSWQVEMPSMYNHTAWWSSVDPQLHPSVSLESASARRPTSTSTVAPAAPIVPTQVPRKQDNATVVHAVSSAYNPSPDYDRVFTWTKSPSFSNFHLNPYHRFCHWYKGDKTKKLMVQAEESWIETFSRQRKKVGVLNRTLIQLHLDCYRIMKESPFGTGNWVQMLMMMRLAAAGTAQPSYNTTSTVDLILSCTDDDSMEGAKSLVLPWIMGNFSAWETLQVLSRYWGQHQPDFNCYETGWNSLPVGWVVPLLQQDLRRMAVALVGVPTDLEHPAHEWLIQQQNQSQIASVHQHASLLIPNVILDDVAIHFRCGDIMISRETYFRFLKYHEFSSRIDPTATSIGIVTQPFGKEIAFGNVTIGQRSDNDQARARDVGNPFRDFLCRRVVRNFQDHLQAKFPNARVSIHNGRDETIALAYVRMVMAKKQAFAFPDSSFSIYPVLASFGTPVLFYPTKSPYHEYASKNSFLQKLRDVFKDQPHDFFKAEWMEVSAEHSLFSIETLHMSRMHGGHREAQMQAAKDILEWFTNETLVKPQFPQIPRYDGL